MPKVKPSPFDRYAAQHSYGKAETKLSPRTLSNPSSEDLKQTSKRAKQNTTDQKFNIRMLRENEPDSGAQLNNQRKRHSKPSTRPDTRSSSAVKLPARPPSKGILKTSAKPATLKNELSYIVISRRERVKSAIDQYSSDLLTQLDKLEDENTKQAFADVLYAIERDDDVTKHQVAQLFGMAPTSVIKPPSPSLMTPRKHTETILRGNPDDDSNSKVATLGKLNFQIDTSNPLAESEAPGSISDMAIFNNKIAYVSDPVNGSVRMFDLWKNRRNLGEIAGISACNQPSQLAVDASNGEVLIGCRGDETIYLFEVNPTKEPILHHRLVKAYPNIFTPLIGTFCVFPTRSSKLRCQFAVIDSQSGIMNLISRQGNSMIQVKHFDLARATCSAILDDTNRSVLMVGSKRCLVAAFDTSNLTHLFTWPECDKKAPRVGQVIAISTFRNYVLVLDSDRKSVHELEYSNNNKARPLAYRRTLSPDLDDPVAIKVMYDQSDRRDLILVVTERNGWIKVFPIPKVPMSAMKAPSE